MRERLNDEAAFEAALRDKTGERLELYAYSGGRRAAEAGPLGSQRRFQHCEQIDTEDCWRGLLKPWPGSPEREALIRERLHRATLAVTPRTEAGLKQFLERHPHSVVAAEVREQLLPVAALQEVPSNNVIGLRRFRERYPRSVVDAQAQARIQELFAAARAGFPSQASPRNPQAVEFMSQLLTYLESSESSRARVGFRRLLASSLSPWSAARVRSHARGLEGPTVKQLDDALQRPFYGATTLERSELPPTEDTGVTHPRTPCARIRWRRTSCPKSSVTGLRE